MRCANCGKPLREQSRFCTGCGTPVPNESVAQRGVIAPADDAGRGTEAVRAKARPALPRLVKIVAPVFVVGIAIAAYGVYHQTTTPSAPGAGWGVHVCSVEHYVPGGVYCAKADSTVSIDNGYLAFSGSGGANFSATGLQLLLSKVNADGSNQVLGQVHELASLSVNSMSFHLKDLLSQANVTPNQGDSYTLEVDSDSGATQKLLGTATFTVGPHQPTRCAGGGYSLSLPYDGWEISKACTGQGDLLAGTPDQKAGIEASTYPGSQPMTGAQLQSWSQEVLTKSGTVQGTPKYATTMIGGTRFTSVDARVKTKQFGTVDFVLRAGVHGTRAYLFIGFSTENSDGSPSSEAKHVTQVVSSVRFI